MTPRSIPRPLQAAAVLVALMVIAAACGQKPDVAQVRTGGGDAALGDGLGDDADDPFGPGPGDGDGFDNGFDDGTGDPGPGTDDPGTGPGDPGTGPGDPGEGSASPGDPDGPAPPGDRTGISDNEIRIGIHAPVTGAAPFPQETFNRGREVYWRWLDGQGGVHGGKRVSVFFADDEFNPQRAVAVCRRMVEQDKVFLLVGGGGADQITACAQYANRVGVPYLSAGVNEDGLAGIRAYFALSQTYSQQSPVLASLAANRLPGTKVGIVVADTRSFNDARASITRAMEAAGLEIVHNSSIDKNANESQALAKANELRTDDAEIVYVLMSPTVFLRLASAGQGQGYVPDYIGPGVTNGLNLVAQVGCPGIGEARFLSPFPQLDVIDQLDPNFRPAYREHTGADADDIGIALWGLNKAVHAMFEAAGPNMSRQSFVQTLESGATFETNVFPPIRYSANNHFGGQASHLLKADCNARRYITEAQFVSGF